MKNGSDVYMLELMHCISGPYRWYRHKGAG